MQPDPLPEILSRAKLQPNSNTLVAVEIILMVGPPATGKSTLSKRLEKEGYGRVNQDTLKTIQKCLAAAKSILVSCIAKAASASTSAAVASVEASDAIMATTTTTTPWRGVVVDNTNMDSKVRKLWIQMAQELGIQVSYLCG